MSQTFDCLILGAGPVGMVCALALRQKGFSVAWVEATAPQLDPKACDTEDSRCFALSHDVLTFLHAVGVDCPYVPIHRVMLSHAKDQNPSHPYGFSSEEGNVPFLGTVIPSSMLWKNLRTLCHDIPQYCPATVRTWEKTSKGWNLILDTGDSLKASLVLGADGRHSAMRARFAPAGRGWTFPQKALVFSFAPFSLTCAYEHFFSGGSLALLPLPNDTGTGVWIGPPQDLESLNLKEAVSDLLGNPIACIRAQQVFSLSCQRFSPITFYHAVLLGDAAQVLHPIAGQGLNVGLRGVQFLVQHLSHQRALGLDWASMSSLRIYEHHWKKHSWPLYALSNALVYGLSLKNIPGLWLLASAGLQHSSRFRRWLAYHAAGQAF